MRYLALCFSVVISALGIYASVKVVLESGEFPIRVFFGVIGCSFLTILIGTAYGMVKEVNGLVRGFVACSCCIIPVAWLIGCLDVGMISGMEIFSVFLIALFSLVQWFAFESFRIRGEG